MLIRKDDSHEQIIQSVKHELHRGALDSRHPFRFVCLGTQGAHGPSMRYVVLREVTSHMEFLVYTDQRSSKIEEIQANKSVSLLFYHPAKRVQIRVEGQVNLHHGDSLAAKHWNNVQGEGRKAYGSVISPGTPINGPVEAFQWPETIDSQNFVVLRINPVELEVLQLNGVEHLRVRLDKSGSGWSAQWLAP